MTTETRYCDWIAVDWGTSNLRAWAMRANEPIAEVTSGKGMGTLEKTDFEPALLELIDPWLGASVTTVVACGMVGARTGWAEAAYASVPCAPAAPDMTRPRVTDHRIAVHIVPGLSQSTPPDVMRGEETQIAGLLTALKDFDGIVCLPGTHTKWVQVSAGEVVSFRTFMSGELFALLSRQSVLRHSVASGWDDAAFLSAIDDALSRPEALAARLFTLRADDLLNGTPSATARARLSGLLIGAELAAARPYWLGQRVVIIGDPALSKHYATALERQGVTAETGDATAATLTGLAAARALIEETQT
jgi:2-dehydro-3-deoxygalactonokinase